MKLLISQKDSLFDLIEETDFFSPSQFEIIERKQDNSEYITEIKLKGSDYYFRFIPVNTFQGIFFANFSPGEQSIIEGTSNATWTKGIIYFEEWLNSLRRELAASNKWERLIEEINFIKLVPTNEQTKFTYEEYIATKEKLDQIKNSLSGIPLLEEQQTALVNQLNHLSELAKELNKFDWKNLFIGTIISIVIQLYVTRENADKLWHLIKTIFSNFFLP